MKAEGGRSRLRQILRIILWYHRWPRFSSCSSAAVCYDLCLWRAGFWKHVHMLSHPCPAYFTWLLVASTGGAMVVKTQMSVHNRRLQLAQTPSFIIFNWREFFLVLASLCIHSEQCLDCKTHPSCTSVLFHTTCCSFTNCVPLFLVLNKKTDQIVKCEGREQSSLLFRVDGGSLTRFGINIRARWARLISQRHLEATLPGCSRKCHSLSLLLWKNEKGHSVPLSQPNVSSILVRTANSLH